MSARRTDAGPLLDREASRLVSERVRELRTSLGMPQLGLAAGIGIDQAMVCRLERRVYRWRQGDAERALVFLARCLEAQAPGAERDAA